MDQLAEQQQKLLKAQLDISQELSSGTDAEDLLDHILAVSRDVFRFENAIIRLFDERQELLLTAASFGYSAEAAGREIRKGEGVIGQAAASGEPVLVGDVRQVSGYISGINDAWSELAVPLLVQGRVIGVFNVESNRLDAFQPSDIPPLMTLASLAAIAIENARLYRGIQRAGEKNQALDQLNSQILESSSLGIYTLDTRFRITSWNRQMEAFSGVSKQQALGKKLQILFPHLRDEGFEGAILQVLEQGAPGKLKLAHRNLQGELRFQKRRLTPLLENGWVKGVLVMVEDITEFRRLMDQTIQSEKLAEVGRLSAGIAHEVNNPLSVIAYATELLLREDAASSFQTELLERIAREVERLKTLTGGLLSFSRSGETRMRTVDLIQTLRDVLLLLHYELNRHQIELIEEFLPIPTIQGDPNKLKQVFINLIMNAIQAMHRCGRMVIASGIDVDGNVFVAISDNGPGIPEDIREQIFEPFFSTKKEGEGTGLGLYLSRNIIREHDGQLLLESVPGQTMFRAVFSPRRLPEV
jgi:two-component system, NtrC family, sensor kinase